MHTRNIGKHIVALAAALLLTVGAMAADITGFKAVALEGTAQIKVGDAAAQPIELDKQYPFGATVMTGRNSWVNLEFNQGNTFRLLARSSLEITEDVKNPKLKKLSLETGKVEIKLDDFPKDHKLQVETPTAVCGAVGTRFVVEFENDENETIAAQKKGGRESSFACDQGEVYVASRFEVKGDEVDGKSMDVGNITAGSAMVAVIHEGLENTYTDITVNRGKLTFAYGGDSGAELVAEAKNNQATRFVCALEKTDKDTTVAAMEVKEGEIINVKRTKRLIGEPTVEETVLTVQNGPVVVNKAEVFEQEKDITVVTDYIAAAKKEGELHSQIVDIERAGQQPTAAQETALRQAAGEATALRQKLLAKTTIRQIQQIQRITRPRITP